MQTVLFFFFIILTLWPTSLLASFNDRAVVEEFSVNNSQQIKHYVYSIVSDEDPVTVKEYCFFLNATEDAVRDGCWGWSEHYYDYHLMNSGTSPIIRSGKLGNRCYTPRSGCEYKMIDYLEDKEAQTRFNRWRENPRVIELCNYFNDKMILTFSSFQNGPSLEEQVLANQELGGIRNRYKNSSQALEEFDAIDTTVKGLTTAKSQSYAIYAQWHMDGPDLGGCYQEGAKIIIISTRVLPLEFIASAVEAFNPGERNEYYRPVGIMIENLLAKK